MAGFLLNRFADRAWPAGLALTALVAAAAVALSALPAFQRWGLSALTLAIALGIAAGNTFYPAIAARTASGVDYSKNMLLRAGIVLFGFRISFQQFAEVGWAGIVIAALMVGLTFMLAVVAGTRILKLDRETSMLVGAGSAICGAAAVMAAEPIVRGESHKVAAAVATVVVFGTLSMLVYPLIYPHLGLSAHDYGIFAGSTIHEVAQVVAAGKAVGDGAAEAAVIEKMLRVMMLAPFLLLLSGVQNAAGQGSSRRSRIAVPWFALLFIAASGINSLGLLSPSAIAVLTWIDTVVLAMAMAALGLRTHAGALRQAGFRPLLLAGMLFGFLVVGGYWVNIGVTRLFA
jgi:uncharacterized integral membrane protein (TIGR00698 family)